MLIFQGKIILKELWAQKAEFKKKKQQYVNGRAFHSLSFRLSGCAKFEFDGKIYISDKNSITYMPAGVPYKTEILQEGQMYIVHFTTNSANFSHMPCILPTDDTRIQNSFKQVCDAYATSPTRHCKNFATMYSLLDLLEQPQSSAPKLLKEAKKHIEQNYQDHVSITTLSSLCGISETHFRNQFKKYFGTTPLSYLKSIRIENARHLLHSGCQSITDVAFNCGFESTSYFSSEFRRIVGVTPSEYIKIKNS